MSEHDEAQWVEANRDELIGTFYSPELGVYLNEYAGPMHIAGACTCVGIREGDRHKEGCPQRSRVIGHRPSATSQLP